jgi:hypothetical protein
LDGGDKDEGVVVVGTTIVVPGDNIGGDTDMGGVGVGDREVVEVVRGVVVVIVVVVVVVAAAVCDRNEEVVKVG